jgi:hypothetical protein
MTKENLETRAGYKTLSILKDQTEDYIRTFTIDHKYKGELKYLLGCQFLLKVLEKKGN